MTGSILFVGDIHDKGSVVCPVIEHHMSAHAVDTVVLLGDLLNDWNMSAKGEANEFRILHDRVLAWRRDGVDVRVLLGNHDVIYLTPPRSRDRYRLKVVSPGYRADAHETIRPMLMELEPQVAYGVELDMFPDGRQVLCTHAGVTNDWLEWCDHVLDSQPEETTAVGLADWLNQLFHEHPMTFMERVGVVRGGGYRRGVSPLWADRTETEREPLPHDIIQIVGHTPVTTITPASYPAAYPSIWYCDTMSDDSHYNHLGDGSMLLYGKAARQFQSSRSDLVRGIGDTFAKAAYQWGIHISSDGAFANNPALAQIFDDDDHDEWQRVEDAKPTPLDDELMGVFDEVHGKKSSTGKARANAQQVQAQRVSFAERWGIDIDDVDTTPSTADYDEPDF